jgi:crossover junction endodeoxyribonuclease RusA
VTAITFCVYGTAVPKGSTKSFAYALKNRTTGAPILDRHGKPIYRAATTHDNPKTKGWQQLVAEGASQAMNGNGVLFHGPIRLRLEFYLPRPKSLPRSKPRAHVTKPDLSKLTRCAEDSLTGVVIRDDAQIVELQVTKQYAALGDSPRAIVTIEPLSAAERL